MFGIIDAFYYDVEKQRYYVHDCMNDAIRTKYITTTENWDCQINIKRSK